MAKAGKSNDAAVGASSLQAQPERPKTNPLASPVAQIVPIFASDAATGRSAGFRHVEMVFELTSDNDPSNAVIGRTVYSASDAHYGIAVQLSSVGIPLVQGGAPSLSVSGTITPHGLSPETFDMRANLAGNLLFLKRRGDDAGGDPEGARTGRFRDGLLDRQSLIFHFSLQPPNAGGGKILLSDGKSYTAFLYRVEQGGRESLPPIGDISVTKITLQPELGNIRSGEKIELYLVPEMGYLPVRMRHTDDSGRVTEQRVTSLVYR